MNVFNSVFILFAYAALICTDGWTDSKTEYLVEKMEGRYAEVTNYQADMEVKTYKGDGSTERKRALYTFEKPNHIRLDFESPHKGTILIYPDGHGEVMVKPGGFLRFFTMHLAPDNPILKVSPGQDITQTDLGLLIRNIAHSLTDQRKGGISASCGQNRLSIRVLAEDHFRKGVTTLYDFVIDTSLWLPVEVKESSAEGKLEKSIIFKDLRLNVKLPKGFFKSG